MNRSPAIAIAVGLGVLLVALGAGMELTPTFESLRQILRDGFGPEVYQRTQRPALATARSAVRISELDGAGSGRTKLESRGRSLPGSRAVARIGRHSRGIVARSEAGHSGQS